MELIFCDLDINLKMYNVPLKFRKKLSEKFQGCKFTYDSDQKDFKSSDITIYWGNRLPNNFLEKYPKLKWIHFGSVGIDRFKLVKNNQKEKILITNSHNSVTDGMHAHTIFQIFYLIRQGYLLDEMRKKNCLSREIYDYNFHNILNSDDLNALIVGYGSIGSKVGNTLVNMGAKVTGIGLSERVSTEGIKIHTISRLKELVKSHNLVIGLLPYDKNLEGIFQREIFDNMPNSSYFINNGRASHVVEKDLFKALNNNLAAAAVDVYDQKIGSNFSIMLKQKNLLITPHIGAVDPSYWPRQIALFEYNLKCFLDKKIIKMKNICNKGFYNV